MKKIAFDNELYLKEQTKYILERASKSKKLYIECGGKLLHDMHAARVLPGYDPDVKMRVFSTLIDKIDIIICIHSKAISEKKIRADFSRTYDEDVFRMIEDFRSYGIVCNNVVITRFEGEKEALDFKKRLERQGVKVYLHKPIEGYPQDISRVCSDKGFGKNEYIETTKPIVIVTAPGPGSGKLATALSQLWHDFKRGEVSSYSKFETFPIWNLPIDHPVNIAYEAATADLEDENRIDYFELEATGKATVNYNRDLAVFPVLKNILYELSGGKLIYRSPTDMGVNRCGFAITNDKVAREAGNNEIIRRYLLAKVDYFLSKASTSTLARQQEIMIKAGLKAEDRKVRTACLEKYDAQKKKGKGKGSILCTASIELEDGLYISGTNSHKMHAASAMLLNALKYLAKIDDKEDLISSDIIESVLYMKHDILGEKGTSLNVDETLICLALSTTNNKNAKKALDMLPKLHGLQAHLSHIASASDDKALKKLRIDATAEDRLPSIIS